MARIFIAYAREYKLFATRLARSLSDIGAEVWIDVESIPPGMQWHNAIQQGLETCEVLLLIVTPESMQSRNVEDEWFFFRNNQKPIIPIRYRLAPVHYLLQSYEYIDFENTEYTLAFWRLHRELLRRGFTLVPLHDQNGSVATPKQKPLPPREQDRNPLINFIRAHLTQVMIGLFLAVVGGVIAAWIIQADRFAPDLLSTDTIATATTSPFATTEIAQAVTDSPSAAPTLSSFQILQTTEADDAAATQTQAALDLTAAQAQTLAVIVAETAAQIDATETAARGTLIARAWTPTPTDTSMPPTPTLSPEQITLTPQTSNAVWQPHITERDFNGFAMMLVPAGCFTIGSEDREDDEKNGNQVCFDASFWIDRYEVTNAQYGSIGCERWSSEPEQPRNCVTWFEARDFCAGRDARLPTEAEWEYAARGPDGLIYPWGNTFVANNVVYDVNSKGRAASVGSRPGGASWVGTLDMSGNVYEWTSSRYMDYPYEAGGDREDVNSTGVLRTLRGGSWNDNVNNARAAIRDGNFGTAEFSDIGFRCARSFE